MQLFVNYHTNTYNLLSVIMPHIPNKHWDTPSKGGLQAQAKLLKAKNLRSTITTSLTRRRLFTGQGVPPTSGYRITNSIDPRRLGNSEIRSETRGRKKQCTERDIRAVEKVLWQEGFDGRTLSWDALALETGVEVSGRTLRRYLRQKDYRRCIAYQRSWIAPSLASIRVDFATQMLAKYPTPQH